MCHNVGCILKMEGFLFRHRDSRSAKRSVISIISGSLTKAIVILGIFWLGLAVGSGHIQIGGLKSEQKILPSNLNYSSVETLYDSLRQNYDGQLDANKLLDGLKHGLVQATGDPYTDYFTPAEAKDFNNQLNGTFQGIGAELSKDKDGNLIVVAPIDGFPAQKAGLKSKDIIIDVNRLSTANMTVDEAVGHIRGPAGTKVVLKILRNKSQTISLTIIRSEIKIPSVDSKMLKSNIGYIKISEFSSDTGDLAHKAADNLNKKGAKAIILDLRGDPGGELSAAVDVSSLWLKPGQTILTTRRDGEIVDTYRAHGPSTLVGIPTVVLIDDGSASASEITAGALHDNHAATLIGVKSFGKGSVQDVINLADGALLKVTIARWYTPDGRNIDKQGISPDKSVKLSEADSNANRDPQLAAAFSYLNK